MSGRFRFGVGTRFVADGERHTVLAVRDGLLETRDGCGVLALTHPTVFLHRPDFRLLDGGPQGATPPQPAFDKHTLQRALALERHIREVITGSPSPHGDPDPLPPRDDYDPAHTTLSLRVSLKARELGISESIIWKHKRLYAAHGVYGLVDHRETRGFRPFEKIDDRVKDAVLKVLNAAATESRVTKEILRERVERKLALSHSEAIKLPSKSTLNRYFQAVGEPLGVFDTAKQRKSESNRPDRPFGRFEANRPGQVVMIDSTRLNTFALDEITLNWVQLQLTIALDLYTRSIAAWRITPTVPDVDAALLLYNILVPKPAAEGWHPSTRRPYFGVPEAVVIASLPQEGMAAVPALHPETILVDHGNVFVSEAFRQACLILGISIQQARRRRPTDKSPCEATFDVVKEHFCARLPGFTGADIASRGVNVEGKALYFVGEIEDCFAEWVATEWQQRPHAGLFLPGSPKLEVSPNDAYREGVARAGFVYVVPDATLYYELLPSAWRTVGDNGVPVNGLFYDHTRLNEYRGVPSSYGGRHAGKYPIRYDQRNLEEVFFFDHRSNPPQWIALRWRGARRTPMPFDARALAFAKDLCLQRQLDPKEPRTLEAAMRYLLDRWSDRLAASEKERRAMVRRALNEAAVLKERARLGVAFVPPDEAVDLGAPLELPEPEIFESYLERAQIQPMGDDHDSAFDF